MTAKVTLEDVERECLSRVQTLGMIFNRPSAEYEKQQAAVCRAAQAVVDAADLLLDNGGPKAVDSYAELHLSIRAFHAAERGEP